MRKLVLITAVVAAVAVSLTAFTPAAIAFWSASGRAAVLAQPAQLEFELVAADEAVAIDGGSGVAYTAVRLFDLSTTPLDAFTINTEFESAGFTADAQFALAHPSASCETQHYQPLASEVTLAGYPEYIHSMLCFRIAYSGATSDHIGQRLTLSVTAVGTLGSWSAGTTGAETVFTLTDAPEAQPPAPVARTVVCTPGDYFPRLAVTDADSTSEYVLRQNSAEGPQIPYPPSTASGLAIGWALLPSNFTNLTPNTLFTVFIVRAGTTEAIASAALYYNSAQYRIECVA